MRRYSHPLALAGLDEVPRNRFHGLGRTDDAVVTIDTGFGLHPIGRDYDYSWHDEFELGDGGEFELHVWDGVSKRASMTGRIIDGSEACGTLEGFMVMSADECMEEMPSMLAVEYVRVQPEYRGRNYSVRLVDAAVFAFARRGWWVYADCYSQRIYANLRQVLPTPTVARPGMRLDAEDMVWNPSDAQVMALLDPLPVEGTHSYRGYGYRLANERHAEVLWKL